MENKIITVNDAEKELFEAPTAEVIEFSAEDVVATSVGGGFDGEWISF